EREWPTTARTLGSERISLDITTASSVVSGSGRLVSFMYWLISLNSSVFSAAFAPILAESFEGEKNTSTVSFESADCGGSGCHLLVLQDTVRSSETQTAAARTRGVHICGPHWWFATPLLSCDNLNGMQTYFTVLI